MGWQNSQLRHFYCISEILLNSSFSSWNLQWLVMRCVSEVENSNNNALWLNKKKKKKRKEDSFTIFGENVSCSENKWIGGFPYPSLFFLSLPPKRVGGILAKIFTKMSFVFQWQRIRRAAKMRNSKKKLAEDFCSIASRKIATQFGPFPRIFMLLLKSSDESNGKRELSGLLNARTI